jgi:hypothetical protein
MSFVYLGSGIYLLLGNNIFNLSDFQKNGLSILFISYGLFRFFHSLKEMKEGIEGQNDT